MHACNHSLHACMHVQEWSACARIEQLHLYYMLHCPLWVLVLALPWLGLLLVAPPAPVCTDAHSPWGWRGHQFPVGLAFPGPARPHTRRSYQFSRKLP